MPNNWQMVDSNFPTITGDEPVKEQIGKIIDYLQILTEQLQYQLQNLDSSNWNASALTQLEDSAVERISATLTELKSKLDAMAGRISSAEGIVGRMKTAEDSISALQQVIAVAGEEVTVGTDEKILRLKGTVYINGVLVSAPEDPPEAEPEVPPEVEDET